MSSKDVLIAEAQKQVQKGQLDRAIRGYQEALALDPADLRVRQRLAELLTRANRIEEARTEFEAVGKSLSAGGFYQKAIAVYKQVERLCPDDIGVVLTIAALNEKNGLIPNALAEYKRAYDHYETTSNLPEGVKVLDLMQKADAKNINLKLKYAEVLHQIGSLEASLQTFVQLADLLIERKEVAGFVRLTAKMSQMFQGQDNFAVRVLRARIVAGAAESVLQALQALLKEAPQRLDYWRLVIEAYSKLGQSERVKMACRHLLQLAPTDCVAYEHLVRALMVEGAADEAVGILAEQKSLFIENGAAEVLRQLCLELHARVPFDPAVLQALLQECDAAGAAAVVPDSQDSAPESAPSMAASAAFVTVAADDVDDEESFPALPVWDDVPDERTEVTEQAAGDLPLVSLPDVQELPVVSGIADVAEVLPMPEDELFEIEVDLEENPVDDDGTGGASSNENWFETVTEIFDAISTDKSAIRFGGELDSADYQSHFDLGLALREMGLYDDAVTEFRLAAADASRRIRCLAMQGACLREKGELSVAENALQALLASPGLSAEETATVTYELALTLRMLGRNDEARSLLEDVDRICPGFRDVALLLNDAATPDGPSSGFDFSEDDLLEFDLK